MEKLMLIDGNSILNRAFYAIPLLTNKEGVFTNAVYGFLNIFFRFYDEERPDYAGVAFDLPKPTFRHLKYDAYKGTRKGMPEELKVQVPLIKEALTKMNIKIYELEGFEADDILGTVAKRADSQDIQTVIISGDRDLLQLASERVKIRIPKTKGGKTEVEDYLYDDVLRVYGVTPKEFIEVKALMGDASDNVPGVPSIGEKTAIKIIQQYKSVETAIENADKVKPKKASENLIAFKEQAVLSKYLVTIDTDAPVKFKKEETGLKNIFNDNSYEFFKKNELKSFLTRFSNEISAAIHSERVSYRLIEEEAEYRSFLNSINPFDDISLKITAEDNQVFGISFSDNENRGVFVSASEMGENKLFSLAKEIYEGENRKIIHDAKSDIYFLKRYGIELNNLEFDTFIGAYLIDATSSGYGYEVIADKFLDETYPSQEAVLGKGKSKKSLKELGESEFVKQCCITGDIAFRAYEKMKKKLEENGQTELYYNIEQPLIFVLADMEQAGIYVNKQELIEYRKELEAKIEELTKDIYWLAGEEFNINSPKQLGEILFEKLGLKGGKKTKTGWSTSADVLEKLIDKDEIVGKVMEYRTYAKLKSTYADGLLNVWDEKTGKIYSTFNQTVTATGRISSTEPNLQNIPIKLELGHRLRKVFKPSSEDYIFIDGDYSQIELRVLAHIADDTNLINAFKEGQDIHRLTASQVFNVSFEDVTPIQRSGAKAVNFGIIYGKQAFSLSRDLGISKKEADRYIEGYFEKYPQVKAFLENVVEEAKATGCTKTIFNRIRFIPEINSSNFIQRSAAQRVAMNMPIQGSAADIIKIAMVKVYERLKKEKMKSRLILQVHDELLIEAHKTERDKVYEILNEEMANAVKLSVPLDIDVHEGVNWYEAK